MHPVELELVVLCLFFFYFFYYKNINNIYENKKKGLYSPDNPARTLYISAINGCDYGYCDDENAYKDYQNFCQYSSFYYFSQSICCSKYNKTISNSIPFINHTLKPSINCSDTVIINNNSQIFQSKQITANTYIDEDTEQKEFAVCFQTEKNYLCNGPTIKAIYEIIDYNGGFWSDEYLYVNYLHGSMSCNAGREGRCGVFTDCPVDDEYVEPFWSHDQGRKKIYLRNSRV